MDSPHVFRSWQFNARVLALATFVAIGSLNFATLIVPVYLLHLGVTDVGEAAVLAGYATMLSGIGMTITSPAWGMLGDRVGRKLMVVRATFFGSVVVVGMGLATAPWQVLIYRLLQGSFTGITSAGPALMSTLVPAEHLLPNLALQQTSSYFGRIVGPLVGGTAADVFGFGPTLVLFGIVMMLATALVASQIPNDIQKNNEPSRSTANANVLRFRDVVATTMTSQPMRIALIVAFATQLVAATAQVVLPLLIQSMADKDSVGSTVGLVLTLRAAVGAVTAFGVSRYVSIGQIHKLLVPTCVIGALSQMGQGLSAELVSLTLLGMVAGSMDGILITSYTTLVAHCSTREHRGAAFGVSASIYAIGGGCGGVLGGYAGALIGLRGAFFLTALEFGLAALTIGWFGRDLQPAQDIEPSAR